LETTLDDFLNRVVFLPEFQQKDLRQFLQTERPDPVKVSDFTAKIIG